MPENVEIKKATGEDEDWAVLPFDEAEDETRWARLLEEIERLEKDVAHFEAAYGKKILMQKPLGEIYNEFEQVEVDDLF